MPAGRTLRILLVIVGATLLARAGYILAQPRFDPSFARPILDGAYYVQWAKGIAGGMGSPDSAYYLAPAYSYALAAFFFLFGERYGLLAFMQNLAVIAAALLLFDVARRTAGEAAALATVILALTYSPLLFFASRPLGEAMSIFFLAAALSLASRAHSASLMAGHSTALMTGHSTSLMAGVAAGLASLARPNLLLVPVGLFAHALGRRKWFLGLALVSGVLLVVLPVSLRNLFASGHFVPISSNDGITLYHGNGPGAAGVFTSPEGLSGDPLRQRDEVTHLARSRTGKSLDPVEADRYFRGEAIRTRLADPAGTLGLVGFRMLLLFDNFEHGLDYAPFLDDNPWRYLAPIPFAILFGLAGAGLVAAGFRRSGGAVVWISIGACAATPLVFYVSSRYRLPMSFLLAIPAGAGAAALLGAMPAVSARRRWTAVAVGGACALASLSIPSAALRRSEEAAALGNRGVQLRQAGNLPAAERELRSALALDPRAATVWYNLGVVLDASGRAEDAERSYRQAVSLDPGHAESAGNLAVLLVRKGEADAAVLVLRRALVDRPGEERLWTNLVVALAAGNHWDEARAAVVASSAAGVSLSGELVDAVSHGAPK